MTAQQIQLKLEKMKGRSFEYAKEIHVVESFVVDNINEKFELITNKNTFKRKFESATEFFRYWYETKENIAIDKVEETLAKTSPDNSLPVQFTQENSLADELVLILKDNIEKVKKNAGYIPQAQAINNNVNSILHVQKLKLDMMKQMRKVKD